MVCDTTGQVLGTVSHPARGHSVATRCAPLWPHLCVDDCARRVLSRGGDVTEFKVIVAKNLTGTGHDQRIRAFLGELKNEAEIITVGSGRPPGKVIPPEQQPQYEFTGLTWKYGQSGIDISHAAFQGFETTGSVLLSCCASFNPMASGQTSNSSHVVAPKNINRASNPARGRYSLSE